LSRREQLLDALGLAPEWVPRTRGEDTVKAHPNRSVTETHASEAITSVSEQRIEVMPRGQEETRISSPQVNERVVRHTAVAVNRDEHPNTSDRALEIGQLDWQPLAQHVASCTACQLCEGRTHTVFGVGDQRAQWLFVGEGPGEQEDLKGEPFVGQSGRLLDAMLHALGMSRQNNVYIANVVKCRPPRNRDPEPDEVSQCAPYLQRQIALLQPRLIVVLGKVAAQRLLRTETPVSRLRGQVHDYAGIPVVVTYHPSYLLRAPAEKAKAWEDLCFARALHERSAPAASNA
jgi:uracil-DNA glycosylase family 4